MTITSSTGDAGDTNTIGSPATDPAVISAGATTTLRLYAQTGISGITLPGVKGWINDTISALSSAGFDQDGRTNDVVAPGDLNWALCSPYPNRYAACTNFSGAPARSCSGGTSCCPPHRRRRRRSSSRPTPRRTAAPGRRRRSSSRSSPRRPKT